MPSQTNNFSGPGHYELLLHTIWTQSFLEMEPQPRLHASPTNAQLNRNLQIKITKYTRKQVTRRGNRKDNKVTKNQIPNYRHRQWIPAEEGTGNLIPCQRPGKQFGCLLKSLKTFHSLLFGNMIPITFY